MREQDHHYFTAAQLAGLPGMPGTVQGVMNKVTREGWDSRQREGRGGGREYPLDALPAETRETLARRLITAAAAAPAAAAHDNSITPADARAEQLAAEFEAKPEKRKKAAREALAIVQQWAALAAKGFTWRAAAPALAGQHSISTATLYRMWSAVKDQPRHLWLYFLVDGYAGRTREAECSAEAWEILKADYLRLERPTAEACVERLRAGAKTRPDWKLPSDRTLVRRLADLPEVVKTLAREGPTAAKELYPAQQRLRSALAALAIVNGDGYKHNLWVRFPDGEVVRAVTWFWQDVYSAKILNWRTDKTEHTDVIRLSFGDLVERFGIPESVVVDNTHAAANKTMTGGARSRFRFKVREEEPLGVFELLGCPVHFTTPGHGQAKPVERTFGVGGVGEYIDKAPEFSGAWTGSSVLDKPEYDGKHRAVELADLDRVIAREIAAWNAREGRRGAMHAGRSCDALFDASYPSIVVRRATEAQRRLWLLATEPVRASAKNGEITLDAGRVVGERVANRYWSAELADLAGRQVVAKFDPQRLHQGVHIYTADGRYVCFAECLKPAGFNDANAGREHNRARGSFLRGAKQMVEAERRMTALEVAKAHAGADAPVIPAASPRAASGKVVAAQFRDPLERPRRDGLPDTAQDAADRAALAAELQAANVVTLRDEDDERARFRRWISIGRRIDAGQLVSADERAWHASYAASSECASMALMAEDFPQLKEA